MRQVRGSKSTKVVALEPAAPEPADPVEHRISLNREEKALLEEALEQCRNTTDEIQDQLGALGRWLLQHVFRGDAQSALAPRANGENRVWLELLRRAGGPTLRMNARLLSTAIRIAAWDRLLPDEHWRLLDTGRKELLLPLREPELLRAGAKHVTSMRLTQRATIKYVRATLATVKGTGVAQRLSAGRMVSGLRKVRERYEGGQVRKRIRQIAKDGEARKLMEAEVDGLMEVLRAVKRELRG